MNKLYEEINPMVMMNKQEFLTLFENAPLTEEEKNTLSTEYFSIYIKFLEVNVKPVEAWLATRNMFVLKNPQIGERINKNKSDV